MPHLIALSTALAATLLVAAPASVPAPSTPDAGVQQASARAADSAALRLLPVPQHVQLRAGRFPLDSTLRIAIAGHPDARLQRAIARFADRLAPRLATPIVRDTVSDTAGAAPLLLIHVVAPGERVQSVDENESYSLSVGDRRAVLHAATTVGALRGLETVFQLVSGDARGFYLPAVTIDDAPRFPWRGLLIDVSRHFEPVSEVERTLDAMAAVKLNVLHWHLSDDQGIRVESHVFPELQRRGSEGEYYTQAQIRAVVAYARDRGIRVVPEFDMPGHSLAFVAAYPWLASAPGPYRVLDRVGGYDAVLDPTRERTYRFIDRFMGEMTRLFPDPYWHIGGDEVVGRAWNQSARIAAFKQRHHLKDNAALQAYFNQRLARIVTRHHRRMIGWDEVLHPDLPRGTVVQSWRGTKYLGQATAMGFQGILSAPYYLDAMKPADVTYLADPLPTNVGLTPAQAALVLGGEACMWAELVSPATIDSRLWPRLAAVAERFWSPASVRDVPDMYRRLDFVETELEQLGIDEGMPHARRFARRMTGRMENPALDTLLRYTEPVNLHARIHRGLIMRNMPLTHVPDAAVPDPPGRQAFAALVARYLADSTRAAAAPALAATFLSWQRLPGELAAVAATAPTVREALPAAAALARVAAIGVQATRGMPDGDPLPPGWRASALAALDAADRPQGLLHLTVVPALRLLVQGGAPATATAPSR